jgi:RNA polymerase sigma-70 factor (ECF subfamily)
VPAEFRTALVLFDIEGCSYDEVAAIEAVAVGTVKSRLSRGRAQLRRLLEADGEGAPTGTPVQPGTSRAAMSSQPVEP